MKYAAKIALTCALGLWAGASWAQAGALLTTHNGVRLSAGAAADVAQDLMVLNLSTTRDGPDAATVQSQLKTALDAALSEARKSALKDQMDVKTGQFSLGPRYGRDGKINGWQGTVELVLEGRDFARISSTAGKIQTLTVAGVSFRLSREQRARVQTEVQATAIANFRAQADEITKSFGFSGYSLREVEVVANDLHQPVRPRMLAMEARAAGAEASIPIEAGKSTVQVTVSGSVQMK